MFIDTNPSAMKTWSKKKSNHFANARALLRDKKIPPPAEVHLFWMPQHPATLHSPKWPEPGYFTSIISQYDACAIDAGPCLLPVQKGIHLSSTFAAKFQVMFDNLNQPYPFNNNFKHNLRTIAFVCMGFVLIMLYFQPFGINFLASPKNGYFVLAMGLLSAANFFFNTFSLNFF